MVLDVTNPLIKLVFVNQLIITFHQHQRVMLYSNYHYSNPLQLFSFHQFLHHKFVVFHHCYYHHHYPHGYCYCCCIVGLVDLMSCGRVTLRFALRIDDEMSAGEFRLFQAYSQSIGFSLDLDGRWVDGCQHFQTFVEFPVSGVP